MKEDKQLNFNQPLLSVRRNSSASASGRVDARKTGSSVPLVPHLPHYRSELKSGPIRNPGVVPFQWEQTPGQPKEVTKQITTCRDAPPTAPKLPPGRFPQGGLDDSHRATQNSCENARKAAPIACDSMEMKSLERFEEIVEGRGSTDSGDSDESYVDAPDTLSRTESFFINCSVSGVSGFDDLDLKQPESFLIDPQAREFMIDRFLPAAKAMASETPQYASKKEPVVREETEQLKKMVRGGRPLLRYGPSFAKRHSYGHEKEEEDEEEGDDDEYEEEHQNLPAVCGLLPRFCLKSSFGLLNPVPAMSVRTRVSKYAPNTVQPRTSSAGSYSENDTESKSDICEIKSVDKNSTGPRTECGPLKNDNASTCCKAYPPPEQGFLGVVDEKKHEETNRVGLLMKGYRTFQELLADQTNDSDEFDSGGRVHEKTLYVDTMQKVGTENNVVPDSEERCKISIQEIDVHDEEAKSLPGCLKIDGFKNLSEVEPLNPKRGTDFTLDSATARSVEEIQTWDVRENTCSSYSRFTVPLSLPKSPSDSWLGRTLPSMSARKTSLRPSLGAPTTSPHNLGRTVNVQRLSLHETKEQLMPIPEA